MALDLPRVIEIEPTYSCNLRCRMCHVSYMPDEPRPTFSTELIDKIPAIPGTHYIIGSGFEPMMSRNFAGIIRKISEFGGQIELITNGTLLNEENTSALLDANVLILVFSFDGIRPATYEHIRRRSKHQDTIEAILRTRQLFRGRNTFFCINSTMMRRNLDEIPEMVEFWDRADFDLLRFINMVVRENDPEIIRECLYPVRERYLDLLRAASKDVIEKCRKITLGVPRHLGEFIKSDNPRSRLPPRVREEHQLGAGPGMQFPCKSPWTFAKILPNGDVQLCYQFTIGNLGEASFDALWYGERANAVREKVKAERALCERCEYFRFCLSGDGGDVDDARTYFVNNLAEGVASVNFETGFMPPTKPSPPILVETVGAFNIVRFNGQYLVAPHALGSRDLSKEDLSSLPGLKIADTLHDARRLILSPSSSQ